MTSRPTSCSRTAGFVQTFICFLQCGKLLPTPASPAEGPPDWCRHFFCARPICGSAIQSQGRSGFSFMTSRLNRTFQINAYHVCVSVLLQRNAKRSCAVRCCAVLSLRSSKGAWGLWLRGERWRSGALAQFCVYITINMAGMLEYYSYIWGGMPHRCRKIFQRHVQYA